MARKIYIENETLCLAEYTSKTDAKDSYDCWFDVGTQKGYNYVQTKSFDEYADEPVRSRFLAVILRKEDSAVVGIIFLSPEWCPPDLAIMIYPAFRGVGYGKSAFSLGVKYCFEKLGLDKVYAGCYDGNAASRKMLASCGFVPHPEGNASEKHYITGEPITQFDFVVYNR